MKKFKELISDLKRNQNNRNDLSDNNILENQKGNEPIEFIEDYLLDAPLEDLPKEPIFNETNNIKFQAINDRLVVEQIIDLSEMYYNDNQFLGAVEFLAFVDSLDKELEKISESCKITFLPNNKLFFMCVLECNSINDASSIINNMMGEVIEKKKEYIKKYDKKYSMSKVLMESEETEVWPELVIMDSTNSTKLESGEEVLHLTDQSNNQRAIIVSADGKTMYMSQEPSATENK